MRPSPEFQGSWLPEWARLMLTVGNGSYRAAAAGGRTDADRAGGPQEEDVDGGQHEGGVALGRQPLALARCQQRQEQVEGGEVRRHSRRHVALTCVDGAGGGLKVCAWVIKRQ